MDVVFFDTSSPNQEPEELWTSEYHYFQEAPMCPRGASTFLFESDCNHLQDRKRALFVLGQDLLDW